MTSNGATTNIVTLSTLSVTEYDELAFLSFIESSKFATLFALSSPDAQKAIPRYTSHTFNTLSGMGDVITTATASGVAHTPSTPTHSSRAVSWSQYIDSVIVDQVSEVGSLVDLLLSKQQALALQAGATFDYHCATAMTVLADMDGYHRVNRAQSPRTSIVAGDILSLAEARKAWSELQQGGAQAVVLPGVGPVFLAFVHYDVGVDIRNTSGATFNTVWSADINAGGQNFTLNALGVAAGFLWIESGATPLVSANAGNGGTVDVYKSIFCGIDSVGMVYGPVPEQPGCTDLALHPGRAMIGRLAFPGNMLGTTKECGLICNIGFRIVKPGSVYVIESSSAQGANT